jgi:dephospho-CoA kinase
VYQKVRDGIADMFGNSVQKPDGSIDRKALGEIVFSDPEKLKKLNEIMKTPLMVRLRREMINKDGLLLHNAALIAEADS